MEWKREATRPGATGLGLFQASCPEPHAPPASPHEGLSASVRANVQTHPSSASLSKAMQIRIASEGSVCIRLCEVHLLFNPGSCALHLAAAFLARPLCRCPAMLPFYTVGYRMLGEGDRSSGPQQSRKLDPGLWCHGDSYYRNAAQHAYQDLQGFSWTGAYREGRLTSPASLWCGPRLVWGLPRLCPHSPLPPFPFLSPLLMPRGLVSVAWAAVLSA